MQKTRTQQDTFWPTYPLEGEEWEEAALRIAKQRFRIEDDLLYACITYGEGLDKKVVTGFTRTKGLGYALLVFFARRALNIYRYPFHEDRMLSEHLNRETQIALHKALDGLTGSRVDAITQELSALYQHGQLLLKQIGLEQVVLTRRLHNQRSNGHQDNNYAELMIRLKQAAAHLGIDTIKLEMDTLNSYGDDGCYLQYPVSLTMTLDANDVLYCSQFIASRNDGNPYIAHPMAVESGEWVMVNRSPTGVVEIPISAIEYNPQHIRSKYSFYESGHKKFFEEYHPAVLRSSSAHRWEKIYSGTMLEPTIKGRFAAAMAAFRRGFC